MTAVRREQATDRTAVGPRRLSQKYLGADPPAEPEEVLRLVVRVRPHKITGFSV
ncbi:hypothetical protein ABZ934_23565 [Streptomyces sp. NPDC046557]|uniref:hypothetical protein n=1 Tax=Streptomyces sp. NPDC046557 TaxID=3155372 RepID=UPI0033FC1432